jgi:hypothetical protein
MYFVEIAHEDMNSFFWQRRKNEGYPVNVEKYVTCFPVTWGTDLHLPSTFTGKHNSIFSVAK